jgi:hypothetical protein
MSHDRSGPVHPTPWANDSDQANSAPDGQLVPPMGTVMMRGMTQRAYVAAIVQLPLELSVPLQELLVGSATPNKTGRPEAWLQFMATAEARWRVMLADEILLASATRQVRALP